MNMKAIRNEIKELKAKLAEPTYKGSGAYKEDPTRGRAVKRLMQIRTMLEKRVEVMDDN